MKTITIKGGTPLRGTVRVSGSKNAALPIIFATLVTRGVSEIHRLPLIGDTVIALELIEELGATVRRSGDITYIDTTTLLYSDPSCARVAAIRASTYLLGACLARFGICRVGCFGGCAFSDRPIDLHLAACEAFGGNINGEKITAKHLKGAEIRLPIPSVGATINSLILAAAADGESKIYGAASEPHVSALIDFLISAGASIKSDNGIITVRGGELHGGKITVIGDMIEAGTFLAAGLITDGSVTVTGCDGNELLSYLSALRSIGAKVIVSERGINARIGDRTYQADIIAEAYPGFPTDLQPIIAPLLATCSGGTILDRVWQSRYGYLENLKPMGLSYSLSESGAQIYPSPPSAAHVTSPDLRGGMAAVLYALAARGESRVSMAERILRGYEDPISKFRTLGANISLEDT